MFPEHRSVRCIQFTPPGTGLRLDVSSRRRKFSDTIAESAFSADKIQEKPRRYLLPILTNTQKTLPVINQGEILLFSADIKFSPIKTGASSESLISLITISHKFFQFLTGKHGIPGFAEIHYTFLTKSVMTLKGIMIFHHFPAWFINLGPCRAGTIVIALNDIPTILIHLYPLNFVKIFPGLILPVKPGRGKKSIIHLYDGSRVGTMGYFVAPNKKFK